MKDYVLVLQTSEQLQKDLSESMREDSSFEVIFLAKLEDALSRIRQPDTSVRSIVIGSLCSNPVQSAQQLHSVGKDLPFVILSHRDTFEALKKSISFSPFLGHSVHCLTEDKPEALFPLVERLIEQRLQQANYKKFFRKANSQIGQIRTFSNGLTTGHYLERLFESAPIGIVTVTKSGAILSLNRAFNEMLNTTETQLLGKLIYDFFPGLKLDESKQVNLRQESSNFDLTVTSVKGQNSEEGFLLLFTDVTERKKNEEALEKAVSARDEFISVASHELRTPVTSLKLQLQLGQRGMRVEAGHTLEPERLRRVFDLSLRQVDRLNILIDDLLDISRIETGHLSFHYELTDLSQLLNGLVERYRGITTQAITLTAPESVLLNCDAFRIEQVFSNVLSNAVKYGGNGRIEIHLTREQGFIKIRITDYGIGIAAEKIQFIFDRYSRAISSTNISGLGLGLYICKTIVEAHSGSIEVSSILGKGSEFLVSFAE